jgi:hypothetical protein
MCTFWSRRPDPIGGRALRLVVDDVDGRLFGLGGAPVDTDVTRQQV